MMLNVSIHSSSSRGLRSVDASSSSTSPSGSTRVWSTRRSLNEDSSNF